MDKSRKLLYGFSFGGLNYRFGRTLDGISRTPGAATMEATYRLVSGYPDVYITSILRWRNSQVATYIVENATDIGKRLGKNTLLVPIEGYEEQYWADAQVITDKIGSRLGQPVRLDDQGVYLLISSCNPRLLLKADNPFLLCEVSALTVPEFVGFLSKLLDLFDVELNEARRLALQPAAGKLLLSSRLLNDQEIEDASNALVVLSETLLVLDNLTIQFFGFSWEIEERIRSLAAQTLADPLQNSRILRAKENLRRLKVYEAPVMTPAKTIKVLFLAANPSNTTRLRLDKEIHGIQQALRQSELRDCFEIIQYWAVRAADVQEQLLQHTPDIVHFSGHGNDASEIILEGDSGGPNPVSARALSQLFRVLKDNIRCVILNACYSQSQAQAIAEHIDCVIGMSKEIGDKAAISFAAGFYGALGYGRSIKTAFELGCGLIDMENLSQYDVPRLIALRCDPGTIVMTKHS